MTDLHAVDPIEKHLTVRVPQAFAFEVFTERMALWWPASTHSVAAGQGAQPTDIVMEGRLGGRIYEVLPDGRESDWGRVTEWEPPQRVAFTWHPGHPVERATHVTVQFAALAEAETEVTLCQDGWDRIADGAAIRPQYVPGWDHVLRECYAAALITS